MTNISSANEFNMKMQVVHTLHIFTFIGHGMSFTFISDGFFV